MVPSLGEAQMSGQAEGHGAGERVRLTSEVPRSIPAKGPDVIVTDKQAGTTTIAASVGCQNPGVTVA